MRRDNDYIEDIRIAAGRISEFIGGMRLGDFLRDLKTQSAVERQLILMGEAANRVTSAFRREHPEVPWDRLVQLRNFYTHGYDRLKPDQVWGTAKRLVPRVAKAVAALIEPEEEEAG